MTTTYTIHQSISNGQNVGPCCPDTLKAPPSIPKDFWGWLGVFGHTCYVIQGVTHQCLPHLSVLESPCRRTTASRKGGTSSEWGWVGPCHLLPRVPTPVAEVARCQMDLSTTLRTGSLYVWEPPIRDEVLPGEALSQVAIHRLRHCA